MSQVLLKKGLDRRALPGARCARYINLSVVAIGLADIVGDLQELAEYQDVKLCDLHIPLPIILADFADLLFLEPVIREQVLTSEVVRWLEKNNFYGRSNGKDG